MTQTQQDRVRTYSWADPKAAAALVGQRSGLELLRAITAGEVPAPPVSALLDMEGIEAIEEGKVVAILVPREFHYNPLGTVHGGVIATILDTAASCAVHSTLPVGVGYTTLDLTTKFLRPVTVDSGKLTCVGTVISRGRRTALGQAQLTDERGRLVAHATASCLLFDIPA